ncbi:unnamed protein product, partial [Acidocella sp. C78]
VGELKSESMGEFSGIRSAVPEARDNDLYCFRICAADSLDHQ